MLQREVPATGTKTINVISKTPKVHIYNALNSIFVSRMYLARTLSNITQFELVIKSFELRRKSASDISQRLSISTCQRLDNFILRIETTKFKCLARSLSRNSLFISTNFFKISISNLSL